MAQTVKLNKADTWVCSGTSDVLTCHLLTPFNKQGTQFSIAGLDVSTLTIIAFDSTGASKVCAFDAGTGAICSIGGLGFAVSKITVSNAPAASYPVKFSSN